MPGTDAEFRDRVIELIGEVPVDGISENLIYWTLREEDWDVTRGDVERVTTALVESGQLRITGEINGYRRFEIDGSETEVE